MDTDLLRAFVAVADCEGFSAAARLLNRTQSAVSVQIRRLEERTGAVLFERTSRKVALTAAGERLRPYARQMLKLEDEARRIVGAEQAGELIRLGISEEQAMAYLPALLPELAASDPALRLELVCDISSALVERFQDGQIDAVLAVRHGPTQTGRLLGHERMVWVAGDGFRPDDWPVLPLALNPEGCIFRAHAAAALGRGGREWAVRYTSRSPTGLNLAVRAGLAVTVKTLRSVPRGCRIVDGRAGLPELGHVDIELHTSPARISDPFTRFVAALARIVADSQTLDHAAPNALDG